MAPPDPRSHDPAAPEPVGVMRIIARLNVGGQAIHTVFLTEGLQDRTFHSILVTGLPGQLSSDTQSPAIRRHPVSRTLPLVKWPSDCELSSHLPS